MGQYSEFIGNHPFLFGALLLIIVLLLMNESRRKLFNFKEVSPNGAVRLMNDESLLVLDVREDKEFNEGHIINAVHIPVGLLEERLEEIEEYKSKPVIVYCRTGQRAATVGLKLRQQGFQSIYRLSGGMLAWKEANMPLAKV